MNSENSHFLGSFPLKKCKKSTWKNKGRQQTTRECVRHYVDKYSTKSEQEEQKKTWTRRARGEEREKNRDTASERAHDGLAKKNKK